MNGGTSRNTRMTSHFELMKKAGDLLIAKLVRKVSPQESFASKEVFPKNRFLRNWRASSWDFPLEVLQRKSFDIRLANELLTRFLIEHNPGIQVRRLVELFSQTFRLKISVERFPSVTACASVLHCRYTSILIAGSLLLVRLAHVVKMVAGH